MRLERYFRVIYKSLENKDQIINLPALNEEDAKEKATWWVSDYNSLISIAEISMKDYLDAFAGRSIK